MELLDYKPGQRVVVTITPPNNEVVEFWRSDAENGAVVVATKAQHHASGTVSHDYGIHEEGVEYWIALMPTRTATRARVRP